MLNGLDRWQSVFFVCAALYLAWQVIGGWRRGPVRQLFNLLAVLAAYLAGVFFGKLALPVLRPLGYPDLLITVAGGALTGVIVFFALSTIGVIAFKKTAQQDIVLVRWGYGLSGALLGGVMGIFFIWLALVATRVLGTIAESRMRPDRPSPYRHPATQTVPAESGLVRGLAEVKRSMEQEPTGAMIRKVDPVPAGIYSILGKLGRVVSNPDCIEGFLEYPGTKALAAHPAIAALLKDPGVVEAARNKDYFALIKNGQVVRVANDPDVRRLLAKFELEKALDYALKTDDKKFPEPKRHP
jgi:hypothetical protein